MKRYLLLTLLVLFGITAAATAQTLTAENHAPYLPMPIPEKTEPLGPPVAESLTISYDVKTGAVTEKEVIIDTSAPARFIQGFEGSAWQGTPGTGVIVESPLLPGCSPDNFNNLVQVVHPENYPFRVNCKIYITFPNSLRYVGSAVLIDDNFALTAGHCVYSHTDGGWATSIEVVPAYDNGWKPYGSALSTKLYSWTGWTQNQDFDHDMGLIRLNSSIGNSTGWYGYGYTTNNSLYKSWVFYNPGYPAASPYNGKYMYYWYGDFDMVWTYILYFNSIAYGGQSGSGVTCYYNNKPYVSAVLSHGFIWMTGDTRMTGTKFGHIQNWIIAN